MGREYKIALYGTIISIISFIIIALLIGAIAFVAPGGRNNSLLGIAWLSLSQTPIFGVTLPLLSQETVLLMALADSSLSSSGMSLLPLIGVVGSLPFAIGGVMTGYGFYGFHKQEESTISLITSLFMMIGFGALAVIVPLGLLPQTTISPWTLLFYNYFSVIVPITQTTIGGGFGFAAALTVIILFVSFILLGTTEIVIREKTPKREMMLSAGILTIIGAIIPGIGFVLIFIAYVLLAVVFNEFQK
jgi:hypothetical protein